MKILTTAEDVTDEIRNCILDCVEWFEGQPMPTEEFIDRLCHNYADGWDIESYDNPAVRKIMRIARSAKREAEV